MRVFYVHPRRRCIFRTFGKLERRLGNIENYKVFVSIIPHSLCVVIEVVCEVAFRVVGGRHITVNVCNAQRVTVEHYRDNSRRVDGVTRTCLNFNRARGIEVVIDARTLPKYGSLGARECGVLLVESVRL